MLLLSKDKEVSDQKETLEPRDRKDYRDLPERPEPQEQKETLEPRDRKDYLDNKDLQEL
jgi:hypothetical protein